MRFQKMFFAMSLVVGLQIISANALAGRHGFDPNLLRRTTASASTQNKIKAPCAQSAKGTWNQDAAFSEQQANSGAALETSGQTRVR